MSLPQPEDAAVVTRLRAAGAIPIGKTVTQEYAAGVVSAPARNPWDPNRIPGGSSGGSAASVAAGGCVAALGTDTGGSIRIPASVTGTVGLKPTYGVVPCSGIFPAGLVARYRRTDRPERGGCRTRLQRLAGRPKPAVGVR